MFCIFNRKWKIIFLFHLTEDNNDYQEYLAWAKTNTPEAADNIINLGYY